MSEEGPPPQETAPESGRVYRTVTKYCLRIAAGLGALVIAYLVIFINSLQPDPDASHRAGMRADLRHLVVRQEMFYDFDEDGDGVSDYAGTLTEFADTVVLSDGVTVTITEASERGWAATATHAELPGKGCGIFVGDATPPTTVGGTVPTEVGSVACDR